jgi:hypothetical protein
MDWGLAAAFVVVTTIIGAGAFLIYTGHDWAGAGMIGASIVRLAAVFISGSQIRRPRQSPQDSDSHTQA